MIGLGLALLGTPASAAEPEPIAAKLPVELRFDIRVLDADLGRRVRDGVTAALGPMLAGLGAGEWGDAELRVRVISYDERRRDYTIELTASLGATSETATIQCEACNERRLAERLASEAGTLLRAVVAESLAGAAAKLAANLAPTELPPALDHRELRLHRTGVAGTVLVGAGLASAGAGVALWLRGVEGESDRASARLELRDFRPAGVVAMGAGALLGTVGAALLWTDLGRQRARRPAVSLRVTPTFVGIGLRQRF